MSDVEIMRKGKSYTYQTLTFLKEVYPDDELYFIMGADMFLSLHTWKNPEIIFNLAKIIAIPRDENNINDLYNILKNIFREGLYLCLVM